MQLINAPAKLVLPFANAGSKNTIPVPSQTAITPGAASLTDGFPPLTRTPLAGGGVPPSGLDMNGILFELSAVIRWANAGGGYPYDGTFAADSNVGGYPKGARILRSDGLGYWLNTTDNNTTDPEGVGAVAAGWVPDFTNGVAAVTMTNANVTLTNLQWGKPVVVISGALVGNLNLIFPSIAGEWVVINNTTGAFAVTCKTAAGTGIVVNSIQCIVGDGTNIYSAVNDAISTMGELIASAGGTADALTATFTPAPRVLPNGVPFMVRAATANLTTTPTIAINGITAKTIVKGNNLALNAGDIAGAGHWLLIQYDLSLDKAVLLNPATGVVTPTASQRFANVGATVAANALTVTIGAETLDFRSTTLTSGTPVTRTASGTGSLTVPSGAALASPNGIQSRLVWGWLDNAGTLEPFIINLMGGTSLDETGLISTTAISAGSNTANIFYSTVARTNVAYRVRGVCDITEATAGTWVTGPTLVQPVGGQAITAMSSTGYGQTWQVLTGSRVIGTTYYNTTGKPISVRVTGTNSGSTFNVTLTINGTAVIGTGSPAGTNVSSDFLVPPGCSYVASGVNSLASWFELR